MFIDIGFRCELSQSSADAPSYRATRLYPALEPGGFFFHTAEEEYPWIILQLNGRRSFEKITIYNREDYGSLVADRVTPLSITVSDDGENWRQIALWTESFGGRVTGCPLVLRFGKPIEAAYLRLQVLKTAFFHLDYIEISQRVPRLYFGKALGFHQRENGEMVSEYVHQAINGLYSGFSTALHDIMILAKANVNCIRLDLTMSFRYFKDIHDKDVYSSFFEGVGPKLSGACVDVDFHCEDVHRHYKDLNLRGLNRVANMVFAPSRDVLGEVDALLKSVCLKPENTIAIVYRGTDKSTEVTLAPVADYIAITREIQEWDPSCEIFVQTDQEQARDEVRQAFPHCKFFEDVPVTTGSIAVHLATEENRDLRREVFAKKMMAATVIASRCKHVVTHTGNIGAWIAIYRGSAERLYQFDESGILVRPPR